SSQFRNLWRRVLEKVQEQFYVLSARASRIRILAGTPPPQLCCRLGAGGGRVPIPNTGDTKTLPRSCSQRRSRANEQNRHCQHRHSWSVDVGCVGSEA